VAGDDIRPLIKDVKVPLTGQGRTSIAFPNDRLPSKASPQPLKIERRGGYDHYHVELSGPTTMVFRI